MIEGEATRERGVALTTSPSECNRLRPGVALESPAVRDADGARRAQQTARDGAWSMKIISSYVVSGILALIPESNPPEVSHVSP